jgi:CDP-diacylglycerol--glycerol-3-phosphate 3-phosphatidyltransferase
VTLADQVTLARLGLMPLIVAAYLLLPMEYHLCFWVAAFLCALAEYTDLMDGRIARRRGEVSDFGKLADPFCDVIYRIGVFFVLLLPAGGIGYPVLAAGSALPAPLPSAGFTTLAVGDLWPGQLLHARLEAGALYLSTTPIPWLPVFLMVMREIVAGALRAMTATRGLVLAARTSGKVKAWAQGITIITILAFPACFWHRADWHLAWGFWTAWICAAISVGSICEYIWVNRAVLKLLLKRQ